MLEAIAKKFLEERRYGQIAAQIAVALPFFGAMWWLTDYLRLRYGWRHAEQFSDWDVLLFPASHATVPFASHPLFWGQIVLASLATIVWMLWGLKGDKKNCLWLLPGIVAFGCLTLCCLLFMSALVVQPFILFVTFSYLQLVAIFVFASSKRWLASIFGAVALITVTSCTKTVIEASVNSQERLPAIRQLLDMGMSVNARNVQGQMLLHAAVDCENRDRISEDIYRSTNLLLQHGADPNARDNDGRTALLLFLRHAPTNSTMQRLRVWKLLTGAGANPDLPDHAGHTARKERERLRKMEVISQ